MKIWACFFCRKNKEAELRKKWEPHFEKVHSPEHIIKIVSSPSSRNEDFEEYLESEIEGEYAFNKGVRNEN
jgi:hypothetical protein